ncbi:MAG: hypothetical protein EOP45_23390, partial [Sphingobacteriaceae bacterium]
MENEHTAINKVENELVKPADNTAQINIIKEADKEQNEDEDDNEETLNLTKPAEEEGGWISHWPLLTALLILLVMLTLQFGFK